MIELQRVDLASAEQASGMVIVIDVIRAFTVAGYAFAGGARALWLVRTTEEAQALRKREPGALLAGEVGGRLIPGFDFNNSPARMAQADVGGRLLIQRTGAGTQGAVRAISASSLLLCALTNAQATAHYAQTMAASTGEAITLLPTSSYPSSSNPNEDEFCADYVEALLHQRDDAEEVLSRGIDFIQNQGRMDAWKVGEADFPAEDIAAILDINRFNFAMVSTRQQWHGIDYVEVRRVDSA